MRGVPFRFESCGGSHVYSRGSIAGTLGADRLKSYHHLRRELRALAARQDVLNRKFEKSKVRAATIAFNKHQPRR